MKTMFLMKEYDTLCEEINASLATREHQRKKDFSDLVKINEYLGKVQLWIGRNGIVAETA